MKLTGHKTRSVFERYNIVSDGDLNEAAAKLDCPDVLYAIAGEGWERAYLDKLVLDHDVGDVVQFRGIPTDDELIDYYQQCDLFALPNRRIGWDVEGFGIVLLEAQACGKAVFAGASGGTAHVRRD